MANTLANLTAVLQMNNTKFKQGLSGAEKAMKVFKAQMMALSGAIAGAFSVQAIIQFTRASFNALDEARKAETQLLVALNGREDAQGRLIAQAKELQKTTLFGDDDTVRAQALIAAFTKEEAQIKRIIPLVQDLAQAKQMDLASAADLVSKTLGSTTNALARYGISVEGAVGSSQRLESLANSLTKAFGGQAVAAAQVDVKFTQLKNTWNDLQESFAKFLLGQNPIDVKLRELSSSLDPYTRGFFPLINLEPGTQNVLDQIAAKFPVMSQDIERTELNLKELFKTAGNFNFQGSGLWAMSEAIGEMATTKPGPWIGDPAADPSLASHIATLNLPGDPIASMPDRLGELETAWDNLNKAIDETPDLLDKVFDDAETQAAIDNWESLTEKQKKSALAVYQVKKESDSLANTVTRLASGFANLGVAIANLATNAEQSFEDTAQSLLDSIGSILISLGGWAALVGVILQGGSAIWDALESPDTATVAADPNAYGTASIQFSVQGRDLVGVLENENAFRKI